DDVRARLREREAKAVWVVHSETSTGVVADIQALARAAKEAGALIVVDAVSSLGAVPCETDAWGLDVVVSGSQKALMTPPGLGLGARAGVKAMGLELFSPDEDRSAVVTAVRAPDGVDTGDVVKALRDRFGMTIAGGQGELQGAIFRLGHIGWFDVFDIATMLA